MTKKTYENIFGSPYYSVEFVNSIIHLKNGKHASIWSIQVLNLLEAEENYGYVYNYRKDQLEEYKIEF